MSKFGDGVLTETRLKRKRNQPQTAPALSRYDWIHNRAMEIRANRGGSWKAALESAESDYSRSLAASMGKRFTPRTSPTAKRLYSSQNGSLAKLLAPVTAPAAF